MMLVIVEALAVHLLSRHQPIKKELLEAGLTQAWGRLRVVWIASSAQLSLNSSGRTRELTEFREPCWGSSHGRYVSEALFVITTKALQDLTTEP